MLRTAVLLCVIPLTLQAQTARDSVISVTVSRTARIVPDRATLFLSVDGTAETAKDAVARAETKLASVRDALARVPAGSEIGQALSFSVGPAQTMRSFPSPPVAPSYSARTALRLHVTRLSTLATTVAAALDAGAAQVTLPVFESSQADSVRRAVVAEAMPSARREAEAIATSLGGRIGALVEITTSGVDRFQSPQNIFAYDNGYSGPSMAPEVTVAVTLTARYRLVR
jgi:uncharacterized protein